MDTCIEFFFSRMFWKEKGILDFTKMPALPYLNSVIQISLFQEYWKPRQSNYKWFLFILLLKVRKWRLLDILNRYKDLRFGTFALQESAFASTQTSKKVISYFPILHEQCSKCFRVSWKEKLNLSLKENKWHTYTTRPRHNTPLSSPKVSKQASLPSLYWARKAADLSIQAESLTASTEDKEALFLSTVQKN